MPVNHMKMSFETFAFSLLQRFYFPFFRRSRAACSPRRNSVFRSAWKTPMLSAPYQQSYLPSGRVSSLNLCFLASRRRTGGSPSSGAKERKVLLLLSSRERRQISLLLSLLKPYVRIQKAS